MRKSKRVRRYTETPVNGKISLWTYVQFDPTDKCVYTLKQNNPQFQYLHFFQHPHPIS